VSGHVRQGCAVESCIAKHALALFIEFIDESLLTNVIASLIYDRQRPASVMQIIGAILSRLA